MAKGDDKSRHRKKTSGHGSITKAGKVRSQTPKIQAGPHSPTQPRTDNKRSYWKQVILPRVVEETCRQFRDFMDRRRDFIFVQVGSYIAPKKLVASIITRQFSRKVEGNANP